MLDALQAILQVNFMTAMIVVALAAGAGFVFREMTQSNLLTAVLVPLLAFGALVSIYGLSQAGIIFSSEKQSNTVLSSSLGMILALLVMLALIRTLSAVRDMRRPPDASGRLLDTDPGH